MAESIARTMLERELMPFEAQFASVLKWIKRLDSEEVSLLRVAATRVPDLTTCICPRVGLRQQRPRVHLANCQHGRVNDAREVFRLIHKIHAQLP